MTLAPDFREKVPYNWKPWKKIHCKVESRKLKERKMSLEAG